MKYVYDALNRLGEKGIVTDEDEYFSELYSYEEGGYREYTVYNSLLKNNISPFCTGGGWSGGPPGGGGRGKTNPAGNGDSPRPKNDVRLRSGIPRSEPHGQIRVR